jgi:DNA-binding beta-propeller fold protein YncE
MKISLRSAVLASLFVMTATPIAMAGNAPNSQPNPYRTIRDFFKLPVGRTMGSSSAVAVDHKGNIWVSDRCGANDCKGSKLDPVMEFDKDGKFVKAFGAGKLLFPHGIFIDKDDHIWIADGHVGNGIGDDVIAFDQNGKVLKVLGKPGVSGNGPDTFHEPNAVLVAPNGNIFVADGHEPGPGHNARVVKLDPNGKFILQWGSHGTGPGQFEMPHSLAMDSQGRLFVADRGNNRVQIFREDGTFLGQWPNIPGPSHFWITRDGYLWLVSGVGNRLAKFDLGGKLITYWGMYGRPAGWFDDPHTIDVDSSGNLYVVEVFNNRVEKFVSREGADKARLIGPKFVLKYLK